MIVTTTTTVEGHDIQRYCGIVNGNVAWIHWFAFRFRDLFNKDPRNASLELELQQAEDIALYDLQQKAHALGANAITGVTVKPEVAFCVRSLHVMVTATGTAVTVTPKP